MTSEARSPTTIGRTVAHDTFTLQRRYRHAPATVFQAWADRATKTAWFGSGPDFLATVDHYELDCRAGGHERLAGRLASGRVFTYDATFVDVVSERRIVATYDLEIAARRISVTLLTVQFEPERSGTRLVLTEQAAYLDGLDGTVDRRPGVEQMLTKLDAYLEGIR